MLVKGVTDDVDGFNHRREVGGLDKVAQEFAVCPVAPHEVIIEAKSVRAQYRALRGDADADCEVRENGWQRNIVDELGDKETSPLCLQGHEIDDAVPQLWRQHYACGHDWSLSARGSQQGLLRREAGEFCYL